MEDEQKQQMLAATIVVTLVAVVVGCVLWMVLSDYIKPSTATERKDVVNMLILSAAALVGSLTAIAAVGNLIISRRNLQQQGELDDRRAKDDALQSYFGQMGELLTTHELMQKCKDDPLRLLARAHTLTVLRRLGGSRRKSEIALFLEGAGLINKNNTIISLSDANLSRTNLSKVDLREANFSGANLSDAFVSDARLDDANLRGTFLVGASLERTVLRGADLTEAILTDANLRGTDLRGALLIGADLKDTDLRGATLSGADLSGARLSGADLSEATVDERQLEQAETLMGLTMPDGTEYQYPLGSDADN